MSTSTDGASWVVEEPDSPAQDYFEPLLLQETATWQDRLVGWNIPEAGPLGLRIARPPDEPIAKSDFEGRSPSVGVGPAGIVAAVAVRLRLRRPRHVDHGSMARSST